MEFVLPTLDAILTEERVVLREVVESIKKSKNSNVLTSLKGIFAVPSHPDVTYEAVARIISTIYGELPKEGFFTEQKAFLLNLINMRNR